METLLTQEQNVLVKKLKGWIDSFSQVKFKKHERHQQFVAQDVFIGKTCPDYFQTCCIIFRIFDGSLKKRNS